MNSLPSRLTVTSQLQVCCLTHFLCPFSYCLPSRSPLRFGVYKFPRSAQHCSLRSRAELSSVCRSPVTTACLYACGHELLGALVPFLPSLSWSCFQYWLAVYARLVAVLRMMRPTGFLVSLAHFHPDAFVHGPLSFLDPASNPRSVQHFWRKIWSYP